MPALVRPVAETLTRDLLPKWAKEYAALLRSPGSAVWLVPNRWAMETILAELHTHRAGVFGPNIFTFDEFAGRVAGRRASSITAGHWAVHDLIHELHRKKGLPYHAAVVERRGFYSSAVGLLDELAENGVSLADAEAALLALTTPKRDDAARLCRAAAGLARDAFGPAIAILAAGLPPELARVRTVFVSGFRFFRPCERLLLDALAKHVDEVRVAVFADPAKARPAVFAEGKETWESFLATPPKSAGKAGKEPACDRPAGMVHLSRQLFRDAPAVGADAAGVSLIKAPGVLGEMRLIARRIRKLLNAGADPAKIVVTARDPASMLGVAADVFAEYRIPMFHDTPAPVAANPAVRALLRAAHLSADGWPFEAVTAVLRNNYFRPAWPEAAGDTPRHAEGLLRKLGEPRDRRAYLRAAAAWADKPPEALEDEQAEAGRRRRKAELAKKCLPFLTKFFDLWEGLPAAAPAAAYTAWLRDFARETGLEAVAAEMPADRTALRELWKALELWTTRSIPAPDFWRGAAMIARRTPQPVSAQCTHLSPRDDGPSAHGIQLPRAGSRSALGESGVHSAPLPMHWSACVRVLAPESAAEVDCDWLFVTGLGETSFPDLSPPDSLLDDGDRAALRDHGLPFSPRERRLPREQLLFLQLVARPRRELILSYPAVDESGQDLLPGPFLRAVTEAFADNVISTTHQRMLIEGYLTQEALSDAEYRVQFADRLRDNDAEIAVGLPADVVDNLKAAKRIAEARFYHKSHTEYSGLFVTEASRKRIRDRFGPERVFSPTALETYVACPFRFWLEHLLNLEELEEPGEDVEHTRRGAAYHRALSRLHRRLREADPEMTKQAVPETVTAELAAELSAAIDEYVKRAPSDVSRVLWQLEGERLRRSVARYQGDWNTYLGEWHKEKLDLAPALFEADFGLDPGDGSPVLPPLVIKVGDEEVRIGGRIDRVDVADLPDGTKGFWVIDYKTGRGKNYTAGQLLSLEKLQLPLYALAVQQVFFAGQAARPLGLTYWLVTDDGAKRMLPAGRAKAVTTDWMRDPAAWETYRLQLEAWVGQIVARIRNAEFPLAPRSEHCTDTCHFGQVCRIAQSRHVEKDWSLSLPVVGGEEEDDTVTR